MTIDTRIYRRIIEEHRQAGINATASTMKETTRFGSLREAYIERCAEDRYEEELERVQQSNPGS